MENYYQYVIIYRVSKEERKDGKKDEVIQDLKSVMAKSESVVGMMAVREIPEDYSTKLDQVDVMVRPF
jgi:hypothetical protein